MLLQNIPSFFKELSPDARRYLFPELLEEDLENLGQIVHIGEEPVCFSVSKSPSDAIRREPKKSVAKEEKKTNRFSAYMGNIFDALLADDEEEESKQNTTRHTKPVTPSTQDTAIIERPFPELDIPEPPVLEMVLEPRTLALLDEIDALQRKYGVTIEELELALSYKIKLSRLRITSRYEIILDDFDHIEVKMGTLAKAVFLLYLKHPEGIRYKNLIDHQLELEQIYTSISDRSNLEAMQKSISDLTDPITSNSINEKVSKVKKAFLDAMDDRVARFYYIDGKPGEAKKIALQRSLVIWER